MNANMITNKEITEIIKKYIDKREIHDLSEAISYGVKINDKLMNRLIKLYNEDKSNPILFFRHDKIKKIHKLNHFRMTANEDTDIMIFNNGEILFFNSNDIQKLIRHIKQNNECVICLSNEFSEDEYIIRKRICDICGAQYCNECFNKYKCCKNNEEFKCAVCRV